MLEAHPEGAGHGVTAARNAYKAHGLLPFVQPALEDARFAPMMGGMTMYMRLASDDLHMVSLGITVTVCYALGNRRSHVRFALVSHVLRRCTRGSSNE